MVSVVASTPTGVNFILLLKILEPVNVNSDLKCKFDFIVKNSDNAVFLNQVLRYIEIDDTWQKA